jgi:hypothetical protein
LPFGWIAIAICYTPEIVLFFLHKGATLDKVSVIGWLIALFTIGFLFFFKSKLFPVSILIFTENESFLKRHSAEIGLALAFLSVALTVIGLFLNHN